VSSMVFGIASVYAAAQQHAAFGPLNTAVDLRLALSNGKAGTPAPLMVPKWTELFLGVQPVRASDKLKKYSRAPEFKDLPLESSYSALQAVNTPKNFLDLAIIVFLAGFGLYELFLWVEDGAEDRISYRNIFIVFVATVGLWSLALVLISYGRSIDHARRVHDLSLHTTNSFGRTAKLLRLQHDLEGARNNARRQVVRAEEVMKLKARLLDAQNSPAVFQEESMRLYLQNLLDVIDNLENADGPEYRQEVYSLLSEAVDFLDALDNNQRNMKTAASSATSEGLLTLFRATTNDIEAQTKQPQSAADMSSRIAAKFSGVTSATKPQTVDSRKDAAWQSFSSGYYAGNPSPGGMAMEDEANLRGRFEAYWQQKQGLPRDDPGNSSSSAIRPKVSGALPSPLTAP
jgi:hypothetical protein